MIISSVAAVRTIESEIPVISVIMAGIGRSGLIKWTNRSVITPSSKRIAATSMILSFSGSSPVVSKSNAVKQDKLSVLRSSFLSKGMSDHEKSILK